ncbi:MAG: hypothetical protein UU47_C0001G0026 [candidate division TM6 bacterium GW2011_GWE2_41_16]|nr:MAG: hypothetical protein UU47_C0001G0026 [candidate division TM6 bacterium GW2011_GWE2_41_16]
MMKKLCYGFVVLLMPLGLSGMSHLYQFNADLKKVYENMLVVPSIATPIISGAKSTTPPRSSSPKPVLSAEEQKALPRKMFINNVVMVNKFEKEKFAEYLSFPVNIKIFINIVAPENSDILKVLLQPNDDELSKLFGKKNVAKARDIATFFGQKIGELNTFVFGSQITIEPSWWEVWKDIEIIKKTGWLVGSEVLNNENAVKAVQQPSIVPQLEDRIRIAEALLKMLIVTDAVQKKDAFERYTKQLTWLGITPKTEAQLKTEMQPPAPKPVEEVKQPTKTSEPNEPVVVPPSVEINTPEKPKEVPASSVPVIEKPSQIPAPQYGQAVDPEFSFIGYQPAPSPEPKKTTEPVPSKMEEPASRPVIEPTVPVEFSEPKSLEEQKKYAEYLKSLETQKSQEEPAYIALEAKIFAALEQNNFEEFKKLIREPAADDIFGISSVVPADKEELMNMAKQAGENFVSAIHEKWSIRSTTSTVPSTQPISPVPVVAPEISQPMPGTLPVEVTPPPIAPVPPVVEPATVPTLAEKPSSEVSGRSKRFTLGGKKTLPSTPPPTPDSSQTSSVPSVSQESGSTKIEQTSERSKLGGPKKHRPTKHKLDEEASKEPSTTETAASTQPVEESEQEKKQREAQELAALREKQEKEIAVLWTTLKPQLKQEDQIDLLVGGYTYTNLDLATWLGSIAMHDDPRFMPAIATVIKKILYASRDAKESEKTPEIFEELVRNAIETNNVEWFKVLKNVFGKEMNEFFKSTDAGPRVKSLIMRKINPPIDRRTGLPMQLIPEEDKEQWRNAVKGLIDIKVKISK